MTGPRFRRRVAGVYDSWFYHDVHNGYHGCAFSNYGYWKSGTVTQREASMNLFDRLLAFLPERRGRVLDVACGKGESSGQLLRWFRPEDVVGINISARQLATCRASVPQCAFVAMDAANLAFPDDSFDAVLCIESAFHFATRREFLAEAHRVLRPGGRLVLSDILWRHTASLLDPTLPAANYVPNLAAYRRQYLDAGFADVIVLEATGDCWKGYRRHALPGMTRLAVTHHDYLFMVGFWMFVAYVTMALSHYVLVAATKAAAPPTA
jgi:ubiquinone/menaquinone biosynthesis C-methylase UbiE